MRETDLFFVSWVIGKFNLDISKMHRPRELWQRRLRHPSYWVDLISKDNSD